VRDRLIGSLDLFSEIGFGTRRYTIGRYCFVSYGCHEDKAYLVSMLKDIPFFFLNPKA
jgi:hypothetical protein